jgi:hypothetical protein
MTRTIYQYKIAPQGLVVSLLVLGTILRLRLTFDRSSSVRPLVVRKGIGSLAYAHAHAILDNSGALRRRYLRRVDPELAPGIRTICVRLNCWAAYYPLALGLSTIHYD